jgi:hypothetical protein
MVRDASVRGRWLLAIWIASSALSEVGATDLLPGDIFFHSDMTTCHRVIMA